MSRTIEDQLASLGDAVDEVMSVDLTVSRSDDTTVISLDDERERRVPWLAVAAVLALVVVGVALLGRTVNNSTPVIADQPEFEEIVITDPLDIDLSELAAQSEQRRINEIGDQLTFDWDALPEEWEVSIGGATLDESRGNPNSAYYEQFVEITNRDGLLFTVRVRGSMMNGVGVPDVGFEGVGRSVDVRDQPGTLQLGLIEWVEADQLIVSISGPTVAELDDEYIRLADSLQVTTGPLQWGLEDVSTRGLASEGAQSLIAGTIAENDWDVIQPNAEIDILELIIDARIRGETRVRLNGDPRAVNIGILSVPGGIVLLADVPLAITDARLRTEAGSATVPAVLFGNDQRGIAVPVEDAIDPVAIDFLDSDGEVLGSWPLGDLRPFASGSVSVGIGLDLDE